jgi:hypothetical protein
MARMETFTVSPVMVVNMERQVTEVCLNFIYISTSLVCCMIVSYSPNPTTNSETTHFEFSRTNQIRIWLLDPVSRI